MNKILTPQLPGTNISEQIHISPKSLRFKFKRVNKCFIEYFKIENGLAISIVWLTSVK